MVPRITGLAILTVLSAYAFAQGKTITIKFASEGAREVWIQKGPNPSEPESKQSVTGKAIQIDVPEDQKGLIVCVHDVATGKVGSSPLAEVANKGEWVFDPEKSKTIYSVKFLIQHKGEAVASAIVKLKDANGRRETLLTPADKGLATFMFVPVGDIVVDVDYKSASKDGSLSDQTFEVTGGGKPIPIKIDDPVETIKPEVAAKPQTAASDSKKDDAPPQAPANPSATAVNMLLGIVIIGGIGYAIYRYVTQNPDKTVAALGRAGVPIGDPNDPNTGQAKQTGPPKQIILSDQGAMGSADAVGDTRAPQLVKNPRLVKSDGSIHLVMEGTCSVGRDAGADIPHPNESSMSRNHASLQRTDDGITLTDAGSTNGTFVNGRRITGPTPLSTGDTVQFGAVQYRYEE